MDNIFKLVALIVVTASCVADSVNERIPFGRAESVYQWDWLEFKGLGQDSRNTTNNPRNTIIYDVEVFKNNVILTLPRFRRGVPFTLVTVDESKYDKPNKSPTLIPFPDSKGQTPNDCSDLQNVMSVEVDNQGRLWVLDVGGLYIMDEKPEWKCPAKLVIYDLNKLGNPEFSRYVFPDNVAPRGKSVLADFAIHKTGTGDKDWTAYISDSTGWGIIVFNLKNQSSYRVEHGSMGPHKNAGTVEIGLSKYDFSEYGVTGITHDKNLDKVYYTPLSSNKLYSIPGSVIRNKHFATNEDKLENSARLEGRKEGHTDGLYADSEGRLYMGLLDTNIAAVWSPPGRLSQRTLVPMMRDLPTQWISRFAIRDCWLYLSTNRLQQIKSGEGIRKGEINNRVLRIYVGTTAYHDWFGQAGCRQPIRID